MVQVRAVLFILGLILCGFAAAMLIPLAFDLDHGHRNWRAFGSAAALTSFAGGMLTAGGWSGRKLAFRVREGFLLALETSAYSLTAIVKAAQDLLNPGASIITLTYHGSRQVAQNYNVMGVAKAALEASVRYLANDLGPRGIRVNAISAGPIRTLAASGIAGFRSLHKSFAGVAPLRRNVTIEDVGKTAIWLSSDWASAVTGEIIYVDAGFRNISVTLPD